MELTVDKDATSVNTSKLTAPEGYELVLAGDLAINDGYVYAAVRKAVTSSNMLKAIEMGIITEATRTGWSSLRLSNPG